MDANPKFLKLLKRLTDLTASGRLSWKPTASSKCFRLSTQDGMIEIGTDSGYDDDEPNSLQMAKLIDTNGRVIESVSMRSMDSRNELTDLYEVARRSALQADDVIDRMLSRFAETKP